MKSRTRRATLAAVAAVAAGAALGAIALPSTAGAAPKKVAVQVARRACTAAQAGEKSCDAMRLVTRFVSAQKASQLEAAGLARPARAGLAPALAGGPAGGYSPAQLAKAYGVNPDTATTQTVAIVDAYKDPSVLADLDVFDAQYGLPPETSTSFKAVSQTGGSLAAVPSDVGWAGEITLDVDAVRGLCHKCKILLVEANSNSNADLATAVDYAATHAKIVSNSYGGPETPSDPHVADYNHPGVAILASTGDDGWFGWDHVFDSDPPDDAASTPSGYNSVIAVGGTSLHLNPDSSRADESVWNDNGPGAAYAFESSFAWGAAGSGCSTIYSPRKWQAGISDYGTLGCGSGKRNGVDVAAEADYLTGYDDYETTLTWCSSGGSDGTGHSCPTADAGWETWGGTSLATPLVAAMWGLAGGPAGVDYPALTLYGHYKSDRSHLYDVTVGGTGFCDNTSPKLCNPPDGDNLNNAVGGWMDCQWDDTHDTPLAFKYQCNAEPGYDGVSGVGTPKGLNPFKPLSPTASITKPTTITHGHSASFSGSKSASPFPGGTITSYKWTWGDGHTSTGKTASHTFTHAGTFHVTLTVADTFTSQNDNRTGTKALTITVK